MRIFTRYFAKERLKQLKSLSSNLSSFTPGRQLCEAIVEELSPGMFTRYSSVQGSTVLINPVYNNIEEYTNTLKKLVRELTDETKALPTSWGLVEEQYISVDQFFNTKDGCYLNVEQAITDFKEAAMQFCTIMEDSDTVDVGIPDHNLRILTKLFVNLRSVTLALINVSLI